MAAQQFLKDVGATGGREPAELRSLVVQWVEKQFPRVEPITTDALQRWMDERAGELLLLVMAPHLLRVLDEAADYLDPLLQSSFSPGVEVVETVLVEDPRQGPGGGLWCPCCSQQRWFSTIDHHGATDTRTAPEFEVSHLPGSVLLAPEPEALLDLFKMWLAQEREGRRRHIVCYCTVGYRSSTTALLLEGLLSREAFTTSSKFYNLQGGLVKWAAERRRMVDRREEPTPRVHLYSPVWARLLEPEFQAEM